MLPANFVSVESVEIDRLFGDGFHTKLDELTLNQWSEPLVSGVGVHKILLLNRQPGLQPKLDDVYPQVLRDWRFQERERLNRASTESMLSRYQVQIDWPQAVNDKVNGR